MPLYSVALRTSTARYKLSLDSRADVNFAKCSFPAFLKACFWVTEGVMVKQVFSRRDLLRASLAGVAVTSVPGAARASTSPDRPLSEASQKAIGETHPHFETLSAIEGDTLEAIVARLIPSDTNGPGAEEAGAANYIDRALGGALASSRSAYAAGLAAIESFARATKGGPFPQLSPADQDAILTLMERNAAPGFTPDSATFFELLRNHTLQGTFCDPFYGGNKNFVGWDLLGYSGVRNVVASEQQRMGIVPAPNHKSAYDYDLFQKATVKLISRRNFSDGD
jgi:gluconate 2-dehydrogenase gamma chain